MIGGQTFSPNNQLHSIQESSPRGEHGHPPYSPQPNGLGRTIDNDGDNNSHNSDTQIRP